MPFASASTAKAIRSRSIPLLAASAISISLYTLHSYANPLLSDDIIADILPTPVKKPKSSLIAANVSPYTPMGWGTNRYLTLSPDPTVSTLKKPTPLIRFGSTPLRDVIIAEKYGAAVDARGDCWMWGVGYDASGEIGRSLKGKKLKSLAPGSGKVIALSQTGHLYVFSAARSFQHHRLDKRDQSWWSYFFGTDPGVDFVELKADGGLKRGEKWESMASGAHHLLATTNKGRTFSLPLSPAANSHRQLGTRQTFNIPLSPSSSTSASISNSPDLPPESDPRFATHLTEIPSLSTIPIVQVAAADRSSFVRTSNGRVLGFGANESGQIGLGANTAVDIVSTPVEVVLAKNYPGGTQIKCLDVKAGASTTFFTVQRDQPGKGSLIDLLACGNGITGTLGNGLWSSAVGQPVRVKTVSGLTEYSESTRAFLPLGIHTLSISSSPASHVFAILDTVSQADSAGVKEGRYGKDVMVWGGNSDYQLGNGKRSSLAVPQHLPALVPREIQKIEERRESSMSSGTLTPMPHSRLQLHETRADAYDLKGKLIKRKVVCEETMVAGWNASILYNKILE